MTLTNLFELPQKLPAEELVQSLIASDEVRIERIISSGQSSPEGFWYDQAQDEWVAVLQGSARITWEDGTERALAAGDWLLIPAHTRHRVDWTSTAPPCVWLAVHGKLMGDTREFFNKAAE